MVLDKGLKWGKRLVIHNFCVYDYVFVQLFTSCFLLHSWHKYFVPFMRDSYTTVFQCFCKVCEWRKQFSIFILTVLKQYNIKYNSSWFITI